ncbi:hypothetical protein [Gordonia sp. NPDC003376]
MVRRKSGREWTAAGLPGLRDRLADEHWASLERTRQFVAEGRITADQGQIMADDMTSQAVAIRDAPLYWVTAQMVDVAVGAATSLPEWTPSVAMPSETGLLAWARPAGEIGWQGAHGDETVDWDAIWWRHHHGRLRIALASRLLRHRDGLSPGWASTPLMATQDLRVGDAHAAHTSADLVEDQTGSEASAGILSVVGSAWLLMGQPRITEVAVQRADTGRVEPAGPPPDGVVVSQPRSPRDVLIIDLHHQAPREHDDATDAERKYHGRWWVSGHWRQQACGPERSQRRPTWIAPHIKGPEGAPMDERPRVHVWRR